MVSYNSKKISAISIAKTLYNGVDVLVWDDSWEPIFGAVNWCGIGENGKLIYPKIKLIAKHFSNDSFTSIYNSVREILNDAFNE